MNHYQQDTIETLYNAIAEIEGNILTTGEQIKTLGAAEANAEYAVAKNAYEDADAKAGI